MESILYSNFGSIFVYPKGENQMGLYVGCIDGDAISEPKGDLTLIRCFDVFGRFRSVGHTQAPPDPVTTTLTSLSYTTRNFLERVRGKFGLVLLQHDGGRVDTLTDWARALVLGTCRVTGRTFDNVIKREEINASTDALDVSAEPPLLDCAKLTGRSTHYSATTIPWCVHFLPEVEGYPPMKFGLVGCTPAAGAKPKVLYTVDGGESWITTPADPFAINDLIASCLILDLGNGNHRFVVFKMAGAGTQGMCAYSDDYGTTWTNVNIGGAAAGHAPARQASVYCLDQRHIWMASKGGYVYFSSDGCQTWTAQVAGTLEGSTISDLYAISFDEAGMLGMAVGKYVVAEYQAVHTFDGGVTWHLGIYIGGATALWDAWNPANPDYTSVCVIDEDHLWIGSDDGQLHGSYSRYQGMHNRVFPQNGADPIDHIIFLNPWVGFFVTRGTRSLYQTVDGGYTWVARPDQSATPVAPVGIAVGDQNYVIGVGASTLGTDGGIAVYDETAA